MAFATTAKLVIDPPAGFTSSGQRITNQYTRNIRRKLDMASKKFGDELEGALRGYGERRSIWRCSKEGATEIAKYEKNIK